MMTKKNKVWDLFCLGFDVRSMKYVKIVLTQGDVSYFCSMVFLIFVIWN